jgi:TRAP-type C4-dicarboxylate transport system permease small subunit
MSAPSEGDGVHRAPLARWTRYALTAMVSITIFAMMMLTTADVVGRALFSKPIKGSFEIVTFLLAILIFCALPLVTWDEKHINVRLFDHWIAGPVQRLLALAWTAIMTIIMALITWRMWIQADLMAQGRHVTGFLEWPIAPIAYFMSVLSGVTTIILVVQTWRKLSEFGDPRSPIRRIDAGNPGAD